MHSGARAAVRTALRCLLGSSDAHDELRQLEASSTFLVPLDRRRGWYRYHALFREFLLGELDRSRTRCHRRSCTCGRPTGTRPTAPRQGARAPVAHGRTRPVCSAGDRLILPTYQAGQMSTVQRWLRRSVTPRPDYPPLAVLATWTAVLSGETTEAERWARSSTGLVRPRAIDGAASFDSSRAMLRSFMCRRPDLSRRSPMPASRSSRSRRGACGATGDREAGLAHLLTGEPDVAHDLFVEASALAEGGNADTGPSSRASSQSWPWMPASGRRLATTWSARSPRSTSTACTTTRRVCSRSPRGPVGGAPGRSRRGRAPAHPGDAGPAGEHGRHALPRSPRTTAARQGVLEHRRVLDRPSPAARDRRHHAAGRSSASWRAVAEFRRS